jgi:type II secretory pathway pseudopilin PulG
LEPTQQPQPKTGSTLAIVGLVLSIIGLCFFPLALIGAILAIIALVRMPSGAGGKVPAIVALVLPIISIPVTGILAAMAIPNFIKYQDRAKQVECRVNLKAFYTAEKSLYAESSKYTDDLAELQWKPESTRYGYLIGKSSVNPSIGEPVAFPRMAAGNAPVGLTGTCPRCSVTAVCAGKLGSRTDIWSISTVDRTAENGEAIPEGVPHNDAESSPP